LIAGGFTCNGPAKLDDGMVVSQFELADGMKVVDDTHYGGYYEG